MAMMHWKKVILVLYSLCLGYLDHGTTTTESVCEVIILYYHFKAKTIIRRNNIYQNINYFVAQKRA